MTTTNTANPLLDDTLGIDRAPHWGEPRAALYPGLKHSVETTPGKFGDTNHVIGGVVLAALGQEAAFNAVEDPEAITITMGVAFLKAALVERGELTTKGEMLRRGATLLVGEGSVFQAGVMVAKVTCTFLRRL